MFRQMLLSSAARLLHAPEDDEGSDPDLELDDELPDEEDDEDEVDEDQDDDPDQDDGEDEPAPRPSTRGDNRVSAATKIAAEAKREAKAASERAEALERELIALRQPRETQEQINERLAQMEPIERLEYLRRQDAQTNANAIAQIRWESQEADDKRAYESLAARKPIANKLRDEVEDRLALMRKQGTTASRETVLKYLIGERAMDNETRATTRARKTADANRSNQSGRPVNSRADASSSDGRRASTKAQRDKRVESYEL